MVKLPFALRSHPDGGADDGAMPSGTAWASVEAAKKSGARRPEERIVSFQTSIGY